MTIRRLLIADRAEIAARIIRTCQRLGIETVLGAYEADLAGVPARLADQVVRMGPPSAAAGDLVDAVVAAARAVGADAVHPGHGLLSGNPRLAQACERAGILFVGPTAGQLTTVGDTPTARRYATGAGLPVVPGGERYATSGRHVEVQVLGDGADAVPLGDRDCSIRWHSRTLITEAPAPGLDDDLRSRMHAAAAAYARRLGYRGAGTVEFLVGPEPGAFAFGGMNPGIAPEHPVTEAITGVDLVAEQIALAEGLPLRITPDAVAPRGHAIGCRITCEDWLHEFRPTPGTVTRIAIPVGPGLRVDTHLQAGDEIPASGDPAVATLVASGSDRAEALARLRSALRRFTVDGVATTVPMHLALAQEPEFVAGGVDTVSFARFLERRTREAVG